MTQQIAHLTITERRVIAPDTDAPYRYALIASIDSPFVPAVGDLVSTWSPIGTWRVIDRGWSHPAEGSISHRDGDGPIVDLMVERADGLWANEAELTDAERDDDPEDSP